MTTRDKGITAEAQFPYTNTNSAFGFVTTDVPYDYTRKQAWIYGPAATQPYNSTPTTLTFPTGFTIVSQNARNDFAAVGGSIYANTGIGTGGNVSGNLVVEDNAGNGGAWNTAHLQLKSYHLWFDPLNRLRYKLGAPTFATDGQAVGWDFAASGGFDPPNLAAGTGVTMTLGVAGVVLGDVAVASFSLDLQGITLTAYVSAVNVVSVRFQNGTAGALDLAVGTVNVKVAKL